jgi:hypothetical protein
MKSYKKFLNGIYDAIEAEIPVTEIKKVIEDFKKIKNERWSKLKTNAERIGFIIYAIISTLLALSGRA